MNGHGLQDLPGKDSEGTRQSLGGSGYAVQARCDCGTCQIFLGQEECHPSWEWQCTVSRMSESNSTTSMRVVPALRSWGYSASRNLEGTWDPELGLHSAVTNLRAFMLVQQGACSLGSQFLSVPAGLSLLTLGENTVSAQRQSCPSQHHAREVDGHSLA